jgi:hypothetical protein
MAAVGWDSGEHGGTVILFGLIATLFQLAVWGSGWMITRRSAPVTRRVAFGAGATISLVIALLVLAVTVSPAWAVTTYVLLASLTVAVVALWPDLGVDRQDRSS